MCVTVRTTLDRFGRVFTLTCQYFVMPALARFVSAHAAAAPPSLDLLVRWQVKECLICSWHDLAEPCSLEQMWRFLQQGRYSHAHPVEDADGAVTQ
jgi:hypothetical protein